MSVERPRPLPLRESLRLDVLAHIPEARRGVSGAGRARMVAGVVLRSPGFHLMLGHRLAHALAHRGGIAGRVLAGSLFWWNRHLYGCSIASTARLGGGLILPHPQGIVIGAGAVVGPRCWIFQNVTIGGAPGKDGMPAIGADARIYSGAVVAGPVTIGENVVIGANAVVTRDVPPRTLVRCSAVELVPLPEPYRVAER